MEKRCSRAQTIVELMILLAISLVALAIIYNLYISQYEANVLASEKNMVSNTLQRMVNAANTLQYSSADSKIRVFMEFPEDVQLSDSNISGNSLAVKLSNGSLVLNQADINFDGNWKREGDRYVTGGYYATFVFNGTLVKIYYDDFDLSNEAVYVSAKQGTTKETSFSVRNNSANPATFFLQESFSNSPFASVALGSGDDYFTLSAGETRIIDLTFTLSESAYGNYSGSVTVIGTINDGFSDTNITKSVSLSIESFLEVKEVMIYPKTTIFSAAPDSNTSKDFSICNSTSSTASLTWTRLSSADANMILWYDFPFVDEDNQLLSSVDAYSCREFSITFDVPPGATQKTYDTNFTATFFDGNTYTAYVYLTVT